MAAVINAPVVVHGAKYDYKSDIKITPNYKSTVLTVGYLTTLKGDLKDKQGLGISGAITMALDEVRIIFNIIFT